MANNGGPLAASWSGYIGTTMDALLLFEACLDGYLQHVPRRPHDREREALIRSGNVFIYEEHSSGIKRWTDGFNWSPSRILNNFLIYRELDRDFPSGEKKKANRRKRPGGGGITRAGESSRTGAALGFATAAAAEARSPNSPPSSEEERETRALVGSLVDSYPFKDNGLVKKTISVQWQGVPHHLVSYYTLDDVKEGRLRKPSEDPVLGRLMPRSELIEQQNFRMPVDQEEYPGLERRPTFVIPHSEAHAMPFPNAPVALPRSMSMPGLPVGMPGYPGPPAPFGMTQMMPSAAHNGIPTTLEGMQTVMNGLGPALNGMPPAMNTMPATPEGMPPNVTGVLSAPNGTPQPGFGSLALRPARQIDFSVPFPQPSPLEIASPNGQGMMFDSVVTSAGLSHALLATAADPGSNVMGNDAGASEQVMSAFDTQDHHHRSGFMAEGAIPESVMSPLDLASHDVTMAMLTSGAMFQQDYFGHHQQPHHHHHASSSSMAADGGPQGGDAFAQQQQQQQQQQQPSHQDDGVSANGMTADGMRVPLDNSWLGNLQAEGAAAVAAYADAEGQDSWPSDLAN